MRKMKEEREEKNQGGEWKKNEGQGRGGREGVVLVNCVIEAKCVILKLIRV